MKGYGDDARLEALGDRYILLTLSRNSGEKQDKVVFQCSVHSDWFDARVSGDISLKRIETYLSELREFLALSTDRVVFLNEYGNIRIECKRGRRGNVAVSGILIKSMGEDDRMEYELETDLASLDRFHKQLLHQLRQ